MSRGPFTDVRPTETEEQFLISVLKALVLTFNDTIRVMSRIWEVNYQITDQILETRGHIIPTHILLL